MINEHDCVVLTQDLPQEGRMAGDIGTVVHIHQEGAGYEVEFMTLTGETLAVTDDAKNWNKLPEPFSRSLQDKLRDRRSSSPISVRF